MRWSQFNGRMLPSDWNPCCGHQHARQTQANLQWCMDLGRTQLHINTLRLRQNGCHFVNYILQIIFSNKYSYIVIQTSIKYIPILKYFTFYSKTHSWYNTAFTENWYFNSYDFYLTAYSYNMVIFCYNTHKRYTISCLWVWDMGCAFRGHSMLSSNIQHLLLSSCMSCNVMNEL